MRPKIYLPTSFSFLKTFVEMLNFIGIADEINIKFLTVFVS